MDINLYSEFDIKIKFAFIYKKKSPTRKWAPPIKYMPKQAICFAPLLGETSEFSENEH